MFIDWWMQKYQLLIYLFSIVITPRYRRAVSLVLKTYSPSVVINTFVTKSFRWFQQKLLQCKPFFLIVLHYFMKVFERKLERKLLSTNLLLKSCTELYFQQCLFRKKKIVLRVSFPNLHIFYTKRHFKEKSRVSNDVLCAKTFNIWITNHRKLSCYSLLTNSK